MTKAGLSTSVIIPCYKNAATLKRALDSVYGQTRVPDEVIVVNDASPETDAIESLLLAYARVKYLVNVQNLGLAATRNVGARAAQGNVICFLDADDELHPQKIELQLMLFHAKCAISCNVEQIYSQTGVSFVVRYQGEVKYTEGYCSSQLVRRNTLTGASIMIARDLFLACGGYDEALRSCEDFDLWLRLLDAGIPVLNIELPLYRYRINNFGLSRNLRNISYWELEVVRKYYARHRFCGKIKSTESVTLALWLFRHFVRYSQCGDPELFQITNENLKLLDKYAGVRALLLLSIKMGLPRLMSYAQAHWTRH